VTDRIALDSTGASLANQTQASASGSNSQCENAYSADYGLTIEDPVKVGGGVFGSQRSQSYLKVLRGPEGQGLQYYRLGAKGGPDGTMVDLWVISFEGLDKPILIYVDQYRWQEPRAPRGFTCSGPVPFQKPRK
jgi:hypothetical protein